LNGSCKKYHGGEKVRETTGHEKHEEKAAKNMMHITSPFSY
jgi:hypothetical protein